MGKRRRWIKEEKLEKERKGVKKLKNFGEKPSSTTHIPQSLCLEQSTLASVENHRKKQSVHFQILFFIFFSESCPVLRPTSVL